MADYENASDTNKSLIDRKRFAKEHSGKGKKKKVGIGELISARLYQWGVQAKNPDLYSTEPKSSKMAEKIGKARSKE